MWFFFICSWMASKKWKKNVYIVFRWKKITERVKSVIPSYYNIGICLKKENVIPGYCNIDINYAYKNNFIQFLSLCFTYTLLCIVYKAFLFFYSVYNHASSEFRRDYVPLWVLFRKWGMKGVCLRKRWGKCYKMRCIVNFNTLACIEKI